MHATFAAQLRELPQILLWLKGYLVQLHCDASCIRKLELAVEEAVVNIIHYAKTDTIEITLKGDLEITIVDRGLPFNPLEIAAQVDKTLPLERRKEGGLGIFFMKQVVDEAHYHREGNTNVLILKKKIY